MGEIINSYKLTKPEEGYLMDLDVGGDMTVE
jgi:hypothetical protein